MPGSDNVIVVGGGICGLACAYRLRGLGVPATVFEQGDRVGGVIGTVEQNGFLFEKGPQSFLGTETISGLIRELGIESELLKADPRAPRYVLLKKKLRAVPMNPAALLTSPLLGGGSRWKLVAEGLGHSRPAGMDESVAAFVRRKFGHEILEYLVTPFVSGVYAGDPELLSVKSAFPSLAEWEEKYGSVIRGAIKSRPKNQSRPALCSFQRGLSTLTEGLAQKIGEGVRGRTRVDCVRRNGEGSAARFELQVSAEGTTSTASAAAVVFATPAYATGRALRTLSERLSKNLSGIAYAPVAVVALGYERRQAGNPLEGFGCLVPRSEGLQILGTVWSSSLFAGRAPLGKVALTSFAGGATNPAIVEKPPDKITEIVEGDVGRMLNIGGAPVERAVWRHERALPQYNLGHAELLREAAEELKQLPGVFLSGNYLEGPSLGNCVEQAFRTADAVKAFLTAEGKVPAVRSPARKT